MKGGWLALIGSSDMTGSVAMEGGDKEFYGFGRVRCGSLVPTYLGIIPMYHLSPQISSKNDDF
jgi:hypothetical protein